MPEHMSENMSRVYGKINARIDVRICQAPCHITCQSTCHEKCQNICCTLAYIGIILSECSKKNSGVTRSKMIFLDFVWRKSRCSMTEEWFPVGSSLQQLIDASYSRAVFWLVTWIPHFYSFLFIEPRTGDIGIMGPYLEWLVVISSMGRSENSRPKKNMVNHVFLHYYLYWMSIWEHTTL